MGKTVNCAHCGEEGDDYGEARACPECHRYFCALHLGECWGECVVYEDDAAEHGYSDEPIGCLYCIRGPDQLFETEDVLEFLMAKHGVTREGVEAEMRASP
jgi:hypothetical protein